VHSLKPLQLAVEERFLKMKDPQILRQYHHPLDRVEARAAVFSEMQSYWSIPIKETAIVAGLTVSKGKYHDILNCSNNNERCFNVSEGLSCIGRREELIIAMTHRCSDR
jgi:hypothetical protein